MRFALLGCDAQGQSYAAALAELGLDVAVCADAHMAAARKAAAICGAKPSTDCHKILSERTIDALVICGPSPSSAAALARAVKHKKHVLCSTPLARTALAPKALDAIVESRLAFYVAHDGRAAPEETAIARQLDQGAIGKPGFVRVHRSIVENTDLIEDVLPRDLDWLLGRFGPSPRVFAQAFIKPRVSHASVTLTFAEGPVAQWIATGGAPPRTRIEVCGTDGMLEFSSDDHVIDSAIATGKGLSPVERASPIARDFALRHLVHFLTAIETPWPERTCKHELDIVQATEAALQSARDGVEVRL